MLKKDKQAIYEWAAGLNDEQLKKEWWDTISKTLGSQAEEMYERGYDIEDIREQQKIEKYYSEESELLENLCKKRGITVWEEFAKKN